MGHKISSAGLEPDDSKVEVIKNMSRPENVKDVQRFLGMVTYLGKFIENLLEKTGPLRSLLIKDSVFQWNDTKEKSYNNLKIILTKSLKFFNIIFVIYCHYTKLFMTLLFIYFTISNLNRLYKWTTLTDKEPSAKSK